MRRPRMPFSVHVQIDGLTKTFGSFPALVDVSVGIPPGRLVCLLGQNGAGKTTLLRCLAGILVPDSGHVVYDGTKFDRSRIDLRRRFMFLPDFPFVYAHMTVLEHVAMSIDLYEADADELEERAVEALEELDLLALADLQIGNLSRGQVYKTALATLMALDPELWLLDEPFASGMDPLGIRTLRERSRAATERGRTIVYSTQILDIAEDFADVFCMIHRGRLRLIDRAEHEKPAGGWRPVLEGIFETMREEEV